MPLSSLRRRHRQASRLGGGTLLFLALMAVVTLAMVGLFSSFADQVKRTQRQVREASYMRYLGDAALTEASISVLDQINSGTAGTVKLEDLWGTVVDVPRTKALSRMMLGREVSELSVRIMKDHDRPACEESPWGDGENREWSRFAFPCEDAGLMVLVASIEVDDPLGGRMAGKLSRAFGYRKVSPAPPKGLNTVTFLAFDWNYFQSRVTMASKELFDVLVGGAFQKAYGEIQVRERNSALSASVAFSNGIAALSRALLKTAGITGGGGSGSTLDADQLPQELEQAIQEECSKGGGCRKAIPMAGTDDAGLIRDCLLLSRELWLSKVAEIEKLVNKDRFPKVEEPVLEGCEPDPNVPGKVINCRDTGQRRELDDDERLARAKAAVVALGGKEVQAGDLDGAKRELLEGAGTPEDPGRLNKPTDQPQESGHGQRDGLSPGQCQHPSHPPRPHTKAHRDHGDEAVKYAARLFASTPGAWRRNVRRIFESSLKATVKGLQSLPKSAGQNLSLENILLYAAIDPDEVNDERDKTVAELEKLEVKLEDGGKVASLGYPGMEEMTEPIKAIQDRVQKTIDVYEQAKASGTPPDPATVNFETAAAAGALSGAYLADKRSQELLQGPVYLTEAVDWKRLQYTFDPSPHRLNIKELFPLPTVPFADTSKIDVNQRGFLLAHANWGRTIGDKPASGAGSTGGSAGSGPWRPEGEKDYEDQVQEIAGGNLVQALRDTENVALHMAMVYKANEKWKDGFDSQEAMDILLNEGPEAVQGAPPNVDLDKLENNLPNIEVNDSNPMVGGGADTAKDSVAMQRWVEKWNEVVNSFTETLEKTHATHAGQPFKAWPRELPDQAPQETAGWKDGKEPPDISTYDVSTPDAVKTLKDQAGQAAGVESNGRLYIKAVLDPKVNRQRSAFRFSDIDEFNQFLVQSCGRVMGTYFVSAKGKETTWDVKALRQAMTGRCPDVPAAGDPKLLQGFAYVSFPNQLNLTGNIGARGSGDTPGALVLVAQGVQMTGEGSTIAGTVLSNGKFFVEEGKSASIEGTLVTTGTQTKGNQELPPPDKKVNYDERDQLGPTVGQLNEITITPNDDVRNAPPREEFMRIIFSPFRVAEDFEMRRK